MELDKYSNNNAEHLINLKDFMKVYYPAIVIYETKKKINDPRKAKCFTMEFENRILKGEFIYQEPKEKQLGLYQLRIYDPKGEEPGKPIVDFVFPRTYVTSLKQLFIDNGLHKLFQPLFE